MSIAEITNALQFLSVAAIPLLFAITVHEAAHGWMAGRFGDRTAELLGRVTINPVKHIDPVGTIVIPVLMVMMSEFVFGWAKPVPVNGLNLRNPKRDMVPVALAGPGANLIMALGWAVIFHLIANLAPALGSSARFFMDMARIGVVFNMLLMIFNLLPILPLDGGRVLRGLVPESIGGRLDALERYGLIIVVGLLVLGLLGPVIRVALRLTALLGVPA
ncbi:MAG: site-2 protease family protein [Gammaproteobacteria bacterium]|jgi:Zn-dependent protease|nr:site-2 protease family protein [Gammaproteobacteria bacterium]